MKRSLISFQALLAITTIFCQTAEAASTYTVPNQLNSIESRTKTAKEGQWSHLLNNVEIDEKLIAKSKWGNGGGHKFKNSRGSGKWKNGKGGGKWSNSRPKWGNGAYYGGWRNGVGASWKNGGGSFVNW